MSDNDKAYLRWYDEDLIVSKCTKLLEGLQDSLKRKTATFLMDQIISKPPYLDMVPEEVFNLVMSEDKKRRWYDFDEVTKIFMELLRHSSNETRREISVKAISFIESLTFDKNKKIELKIPEEN